MINPYANIDWASCERIMSCSHEHGRGQADIDMIYGGGVRHFALSNYYPSAPYYPLSSYLSPPADILESPNAEHHSMNITGLHINGLGSTFSSGKPSGEEPSGMAGVNWKVAMKGILANLVLADGGGVTINHPSWTAARGQLKNKDILEMLDYDDRVLGIEFFNSTCEILEGNGWDLIRWDEILKTGRRCWGFCVADHDGQSNPDWKGRNILLLNEHTANDCLRAYREGRFYGKLGTTALHFSKVAVEGSNIVASAPGAEYMNVVIDGRTTRYNATSVSAPVGGTYIRIEAHTSEDSIYSQPFCFKEFVKEDMTDKIMTVLL